MRFRHRCRLESPMGSCFQGGPSAIWHEGHSPAAMYQQWHPGGCNGGMCYTPNQGAYRHIDQFRQQPQQQIMQQLMSMFRQLMTLLQNISRRLGPGGTDAHPQTVRALPPEDIGEGRTLHRYSNGDYVITNTATNRPLRASIGGVRYAAAAGHDHWTRTSAGPPPQTREVTGRIVFGPNGVRFEAAPVQPQLTDGPPRVTRPDGSYSYTYANGDSIVYNAQNQPMSAVIAGRTYRPVPNQPGHWLISSNNPTAVPGPVEGHFARTPQGVTFVRETAPVQPPAPVRTELADGGYRLTYTNGSIVYNAQNEAQSAVIDGTTYTRFATGLYHLTNSSGVAQGTRLGRFEPTPQGGIRFIPAPPTVLPNPNQPTPFWLNPNEPIA
jgi:hypothetical protein